MKIVERQIVQVVPGNWEAVESNEEKWEPIETPLGFPPKRRYRCLTTNNTNTYIFERQWESMAALETAMEKAYASPEWQAMMADAAPLYGERKVEFYTPLD